MGARQLAEEICKRLRDAGQQALFVGGCVRDMMLGREPADYDVATDATPERVQELFPGSITVGAKFGVILVVGYEEDVEVATFRSDVGYTDGRHPEKVIYTRSAKEDVARRDFTINGLLYDPQKDEVLDYVGARTDIEARLVRAIGDPRTRFEEDKLRMVRAVRFAARLNFTIEAATMKAIRELAPKIHSVSSERLNEELTKILTEGAARRGFELLDETGLLVELLPEIAKMKGVEQPPQYHPEGDVWIHTRMVLEKLPGGVSPTLAWGALLHDVGKPPTFAAPKDPTDRIRFDGHAEVGTQLAHEISRRLRFSNEDGERIEALVANHMRFKDVPNMRASTLKRFVRMPHFEEHLELHRIDCLSSNRNLGIYQQVRDFLDQTPPEDVRPPRLLTGDDLKDMGFAPGPRFKEILQALEDAQLEGQIRTRADALRLVQERFPT
jgi:poly(A) polymerase